MSLKSVYFVLVIIALGGLTSCSDYQKMIKKGSEATNEEKKMQPLNIMKMKII